MLRLSCTIATSQLHYCCVSVALVLRLSCTSAASQLHYCCVSVALVLRAVALVLCLSCTIAASQLCSYHGNVFITRSELEILVSGMITFSHSIGEKMKHRYQSFTRFGRQFQSLKRQVYAVWTSVSFPLCQRSCLIWRIMAKNDEYNDEYLCRDFFVGFNFWSKLSFQIPEFRVH